MWKSREEVTDKDAPNRRIWTVSYGRLVTGQPSPPKINYDIDSIRIRLRNKLTQISAFAKQENQPFWSEWFDTAINLLDSATPYIKDQDKLTVPAETMDLKAIQLLASSGKAWCFGGMGSWNDIGFGDKDKQSTYEKLSAELYDIVNESYLAVASSYASKNVC